MGTVAGAQQILAGLKEAGIDLIASVPDINMLQLINLLYKDKTIPMFRLDARRKVSACAPVRIWAAKKPRC